MRQSPAGLNRRSVLSLMAGAGALLGGARRARAAAETAMAMQTSWVNDAEFIGYFVSRYKGWYAASGIDLDILTGGPDVIPESALLAGKAPLALTTPDTTIKAIATQGAKFRIIGAQFQKSPLGVVSLKETPINSPADLVGKTLAVPPVNMATVAAMLKINGVDRKSVRVVPYQFDPTPLLKGEVDATVDFVTDVPYTIGLQGRQAVSFLLYDFGVTLFNDTIVVTEAFLEAHRPLLVNWLRVSRQGWEENFKDTNLYPTLFRDSWFKGTGRDTANDQFANAANKPLMESPAGILAMTEEAIGHNIAYLVSVGIEATRSMFDTTLLDAL